MEKRVEAFKVKQGLSMFEMKRNVRELSQITAILETAATELEVGETALLECKIKPGHFSAERTKKVVIK